MIDRFLIVKRGHHHDGAIEAFDAYCAEILPRLVGFSARITHDRQEAEDVAIESLARALLRWPKLAGVEWRDGWVFRVAANLSIDVIRKRQRVTPIGDAHYFEDSLLPDTSVEFTDVIQRLPRRQREVLTLRYFDDLSYADIASQLTLSEGSVKTHLHRGVATLRHLLRSDL